MARPLPPLPPHARRRSRFSRPRAFAPVLLAAALAVNAVGLAEVSPAAAACGSFQAIVDAAPSGGTVTIPPCTYPEIVRVQKPLTINAAGVVIDGGNVRDLGIAILANDVTINGLTVTHVQSGPHIAQSGRPACRASRSGRRRARQLDCLHLAQRGHGSPSVGFGVQLLLQGGVLHERRERHAVLGQSDP